MNRPVLIPKSIVFKNMTEQDITDSVDAFEKAIRQSQILDVLPADSVPVMNRMVQRSSLLLCSVMKRSKRQFMNS